MQCLACGEQNPDRARFCLNCGTQLGPSTALDTGPREVRKTVTVLFADMVGFTSLGERLDGESLRRVMDRFYSEMRAAIEHEHGTVAKFIGDAVMAVWGMRAVAEDDALRAVRAAEGMRSRLAALNEDLDRRWGVRIGLRTGVNTGEVVVDPTMSADLLVGDTVNVAARLEQAAPDGAVYVGEDTYRLVRDDVHLDAVAPLRLKGKARPVNAWRLVDGRRAERRRAARLQAPLVGREREVARLRSAFYAAAADRRTKLVTVIGSPGVGKSRLTAEFGEGLGGEAIVLEGRCEVSGEGLTFLPIAEVLRSATGIGEDDGLEDAKLKLSALLPEDRDRDRIVERSMALLGLTPAVGVEETFWAVRRLLGALARMRPVVLVLDDVQWAQPTLLDLHEHLVVWGKDAPVLVVAVARPELRETRPSLTVPGPMVTDVIELAPLAAADSRALVERLLGEADLPPELAERVLETTEGNPLFLGEMLRMLVDDGVVRRDGDRWVVREDGASFSVPPTVNALLAARIERLTPDERCVVERAAVIGQQFYRGAVAELSPAGVAADVDAHLDRLRRKELVGPEGTVWIDEPVFRFHHVLIRDAAYRALLKESRADLHERYADWLEGKTGEVEELVAFHLERAYAYRAQLGPLDERGAELGRRAAARLHSAGRLALAREDLPAAVNLLERALVPLDVGDELRAAVLADLAEALVSEGDTARAEWVVDELVMRAGDDERARAWAGVFACQLATLTGLGQARETIEQAREAAAALDAAGDSAGAAKAHQTAAGALAQTGQIAAAEAALDRALVAARAAGDRRRVTAVLSGAPRAALWGPSPIVRASGRCLDVVRILRMSPGNRHVEAVALRCQAVLEAMRGRADAAGQILDGCRATLEELGLTLELHELSLYAGMVELLAGRAEEAEACLREAKEGLRALGVDAGAAQAAALLAHALVQQGREDEALPETEFAEHRGGEDLKTGIVWRGARARALARRGDCERALELARAAVALSEPTDALADKADALMALAAVVGGEEGRDAARRARELYAAKDHAVGVAWATALLDEEEGAVAPEEPPPPAPADRPRPAAAAAPPFVERQWTRWRDATRSRDPAAIRDLYTEDFTLVDHRHLGWEDLGDREDTLALVDSWMGTAEEMSVENDLRGGLDDGVVGVGWGTWGMSGRADGAEFEVHFGLVTVLRDERTWRSEQFDEHDVDAIRDRFDALCAEHFHGVTLSRHATTPVPSEVVRLRTELGRCFDAQDWAGLERIYAPGAVQRDRRSLGSDRLVGARAIVDGLRRGSEVGAAVTIRQELIASVPVGDAYATGLICRFVGEAPGGGGTFEAAFGIVSVSREGHIVDSEMCDPDPAVILAHLDELGASADDPREVPEEVLLGWLDFAAAFTERDWDRVAARLHRDIVHIDRRLVGWDRIEGVEADVDALRTMLDVIPNATSEAEVFAAEMRRGRSVSYGRFFWRGEHEAGAPAEMAMGMVLAADHGEVVLIENFDAEDLDGMRERYEELREQHLHTPRGRRLHDSYLRLANARDWEALRRTWTDDYVSVDHRSIGWEERPGADASIETFRTAVELAPDLRFTSDVIAANEDAVVTLFVARGTAAEGGAFEVPFLQVTGFRGEQAWRTELFDPADEAAAMEAYRRLSDAGPRAGEAPGAGDADATVVGARAAVMACLNGRDWERLRSLYAEDVVLVDRRALGHEPTRGPHDTVAMLEAIVEVVPDARWVDRPVATHGDLVATFAAQLGGHGEGGGSVSAQVWQVVQVDPDGLVRRVETFGSEEEAVARGSALGAAIDRARLWAGLLAARDWGAMEAMYAPGAVFVDHRLGLKSDASGGDAIAGLWRTVVEQAADVSVEMTVLDLRPRVMVARTRVAGHGAGGGAFEVEFHQLTVPDAEGRTARIEIFDVGDPSFEARVAELDSELADPGVAR